MRVTLEIAVAMPAEAVEAVRAGADRLELSAGLELGGLTPSLGSFTRIRELVAVPVVVLLRPRPGGFVYSNDEVEAVLRDAQAFLAAGADGLVFGALDDEGRIAEEPCRRLAKLAGGRLAFHRAFDFLAQADSALERIISLGFTRILTSGGKPTALEGIAALAALNARAAGRIEIMPGGGIRPANLAHIIRATGCRQIHAAAANRVIDSCLQRNPHLAVAMGASTGCSTPATDPTVVAELRRLLDRPASLP